MPGTGRCPDAGHIPSDSPLIDQRPRGITKIDRGLWMNPMDDAITPLLQDAQKGDEDAFGELVKSHYERVYRHLWSIVRNEHDTRDLAQETWVKAWDKIPTFRGEAPFGVRVARIATRTALDFLRQRKRLSEVALPESDGSTQPATAPTTVSTEAEQPNQAMHKSEIRERFHAALGTLSEKH